MTSRDFCYWLQGYFEIQEAGHPPNAKVDIGITSERVAVIKKHLALVFAHDIDPSAGPPEHQAKLDHIHHNASDGGLIRC